jgi:plasmid stabilization system protein ParE
MRVGYHPAVQGDVNRILRRYDKGSSRLGDEFWEELNRCIGLAASNPVRFHPSIRDLRRANLSRFPYHFLSRILPDPIRIVAVRHHRQNPRFGLERR